VLAAALALLLGVARRAVLLPIAATLFSLLVVAATFGILQLLFGGSDPLLGGPGHLDPMTILGILTVVLGISVTYSTLLLMQTRDVYVSENGVGHAIRQGLRQTAAPATGAGLVMIAALIPFAITDLINLRQFGIGVGVGVAILLEVVIVRPVLLPAVEAVLGRSGWWPTSAPDSEAPETSATQPHRRPPSILPPRPAHR
jgi:RND superfamily putative drug exporter